MTIKKCLERIRVEFPSIAWEENNVNDEGADYQIVFLDKNFVVRIPRTKTYQRILGKEQKFLNILRNDVEAIIPQCLYVASDNSYGIYEYIEGRPLNNDIINENADLIADQLSSFIRQLHRVDLGKAKQLGVDSSNYLSESITSLLEADQKYLKDYLGNEEMEALNKEFSEYRSLLKNLRVEDRLVHGDLNFSNILWNDEKSELSILDFSDRDIANPLADFSSLFDAGEDFVRKVLGEYGDAEGYFELAHFYFKVRPLIRIRNFSQEGKHEENVWTEIVQLKERMFKS